MKHAIALVWLAVGAASAQPPHTTISDTLPAAAPGTPVNGTINLTWTAFTYGAYTLAQSPAIRLLTRAAHFRPRGVISNDNPGR